MRIIDPLGEFQRNEICWCGSDRKYKQCHGAVRARSLPGEAVPADEEDYIWITPRLKLARNALKLANLSGGVPVFQPWSQPHARPVMPPDVVMQVLTSSTDVISAPIMALGKLRFEVYASLGTLNSTEVADLGESEIDEFKEAAMDLSLSVVNSLQAARLSGSPPSIIFNNDIDVTALLGHTLLWAHHVIIPDKLFDCAIHDRSADLVKEALSEHFRLRPLIEQGAVVPVLQVLVEKIAESEIISETAKDLKSTNLVEWALSRLVLEGPTAREVLLGTMRDDLSEWPIVRLYSRIEDGANEARATGIFSGRMLERYDSCYDYGPWIGQVKNDAVSAYVQEVNSGLVVADLFGGSYVTRSPFRARLLKLKGDDAGPAQAALWTSVPLLGTVDPIVLAKAAAEDDAVDALRKKIGRAVRSCTSLRHKTVAIAGLAEDLDEESRILERKLRKSKIWTSLSIGLGLGSLAMGASPLWYVMTASALLEAAKDVLPYVEKRVDGNLDASWIFYTTRRIENRLDRRSRRHG